nr:hypothetical protein [Tanacetum cinerariifolium]
MAPTRQSGLSGDDVNPNITAIIAQQLQNIISQIVTQVTNNVNNANANRRNGNGKNRKGNGENNNGCTYKEFLAYKTRDFDGKGGAIVLTRWIKKMETSGREAAMRMTWEEFKALMVEEFCPSNKIEKLEMKFWNYTMVRANHVAYTDRFHELAQVVSHLAKALTDEAARCGTLSKTSEKRKEVMELGKQRSSENQARGRVFKKSLCYYCDGYIFFKNHFAIVVFDSGGDFSFISTEFVPILNVKPSIIKHGYVIEVADGKKVEVDRIIYDCKLEFGNFMFTIDLIPLGHGRFDVIVGMDCVTPPF